MQMTGASRRKLIGRYKRLEALNPDAEEEVAAMRAAYKRHREFVNDPRYAGTKAQAESKDLLRHGKKVVRISERRLRQLNRAREVTK